MINSISPFNRLRFLRLGFRGVLNYIENESEYFEKFFSIKNSETDKIRLLFLFDSVRVVRPGPHTVKGTLSQAKEAFR